MCVSVCVCVKEDVAMQITIELQEILSLSPPSATNSTVFFTSRKPLSITSSSCLDPSPLIPDRESISCFFYKSLASPVHYGITSSTFHIDPSSSHLYIAPFRATTFHVSPLSLYTCLVLGPLSKKKIFPATINDSVSPSYTSQWEP